MTDGVFSRWAKLTKWGFWGAKVYLQSMRQREWEACISWGLSLRGELNTVFVVVGRRILFHLSFGHCRVSPALQDRTQNYQVVWFGAVWGSGFAVRRWELLVVFVDKPVFQTSQVHFCFAQIRETSVLIKRHVTMLKCKLVILFNSFVSFL